MEHNEKLLETERSDLREWHSFQGDRYDNIPIVLPVVKYWDEHANVFLLCCVSGYALRIVSTSGTIKPMT